MLAILSRGVDDWAAIVAKRNGRPARFAKLTLGVWLTTLVLGLACLVCVNGTASVYEAVFFGQAAGGAAVCLIGSKLARSPRGLSFAIVGAACHGWLTSAVAVCTFGGPHCGSFVVILILLCGSSGGSPLFPTRRPLESAAAHLAHFVCALLIGGSAAVSDTGAWTPSQLPAATHGVLIAGCLFALSLVAEACKREPDEAAADDVSPKVGTAVVEIVNPLGNRRKPDGVGVAAIRVDSFCASHAGSPSGSCGGHAHVSFRDGASPRWRTKSCASPRSMAFAGPAAPAAAFAAKHANSIAQVHPEQAEFSLQAFRRNLGAADPDDISHSVPVLRPPARGQPAFGEESAMSKQTSPSNASSRSRPLGREVTLQASSATGGKDSPVSIASSTISAFAGNEAKISPLMSLGAFPSSRVGGLSFSTTFAIPAEDSSVTRMVSQGPSRPPRASACIDCLLQDVNTLPVCPLTGGEHRTKAEAADSASTSNSSFRFAKESDVARLESRRLLLAKQHSYNASSVGSAGPAEAMAVSAVHHQEVCPPAVSPDTTPTSPPLLDRSKMRINCDHSDEKVSPVVKRTAQWKKGALIGEGAFGKVHIGLDVHTGRLLAVKQVDFAATDPDVARKMRLLQNEIEIMRPLDYVHIVKYFFTERIGSSINIFMEYVPGGSLQQILISFGPLDESTCVQYSYQILLGLTYLHHQGIVHRDIKCANVLLTVEGLVKLADFGASGLVKNSLSDVQGTPYWMAPEVLCAENHNWEADIWSFACTVMEMLTATHPWAHLQLLQIATLEWICDDAKPISLPAGLTHASLLFMLDCLSRDPVKRPNADDLLTHCYFMEDAEELAKEGVGRHLANQLRRTKSPSLTSVHSFGHRASTSPQRAKSSKAQFQKFFRPSLVDNDNKLRSSLAKLADATRGSDKSLAFYEPGSGTGSPK
ncbi:Mitogen-activated protein kinase kinase kinase ANP1 [Diplonema papillatum]|nr:Mitogen-activated protein kinase kinase kinase ANP1 [Diplonema papillatum]